MKADATWQTNFFLIGEDQPKINPLHSFILIKITWLQQKMSHKSSIDSIKEKNPRRVSLYQVDPKDARSKHFEFKVEVVNVMTQNFAFDGVRQRDFDHKGK
jgi:hypothetical protein